MPKAPREMGSSHSFGRSYCGPARLDAGIPSASTSVSERRWTLGGLHNAGAAKACRAGGDGLAIWWGPPSASRHSLRVGPSSRGGGPCRETHGAQGSRGASGLQRSHTLGRPAARGRGSPGAVGRRARATSPNVSPPPGLYAPDGASGSGNLESPRVWGRPMVRAPDAGRGAQSQGIAAAPSGQSPTATADGRDRRHCRPYGQKDPPAAAAQRGKRVRSDCTATVPLGAGSRGGLTRGEHQACAQARGLQAKSIPGGIGEEERGPRHLPFGRAYQTSDGSVDALESWGAAWDETEQGAMARLQIHMAHGPESRGRRTPFWHRMGAFCAAMGQPRQRLSYPPSQSQYTPMERGWGILEWPWNGTKWVDMEPRVAWAKRMTWKGMPPMVALSRKGYQKGGALSKRAMRVVEDRLERPPELPQWDILIHPVSLP
jgi:Rhodopirellula transposase DDE domain